MFLRIRDASVSKTMLVSFLAIFCIVCTLSSAQEVIDHDTEVNATLSSAQEVIDPETLAGAAHSVVSSIRKLTNSIYKIRSQEKGNILFSPIAIQSSLESVARTETGDETAAQIVRAMHLTVDNELTQAVEKKVFTDLKNDKEISFYSEIEMYTKNVSLKIKEFQEIDHKSFVSIQYNIWLDSITNETIKKKLLGPNGIGLPDVGTVNFFHVAGEWETKFDKSKTKLEPFFVTPTQTKEVQMMHLPSENFTFLASEVLDCKMIELPFKGGEVSLVVLLPNKVDGLAHLETRLDSVDLERLIYRSKKREVSVSLPKFNIEQLSNLKEVLTKLGIVDIFGRNGTFTGVPEGAFAPYISTVLHNANFQINEEGSKGANITESDNEGSNESQSSAQEVFKADHPFLFILMEKWFNVILYMGRVSSP